jgi:hypothetical protein
MSSEGNGMSKERSGMRRGRNGMRRRKKSVEQGEDRKVKRPFEFTSGI